MKKHDGGTTIYGIKFSPEATWVGHLIIAMVCTVIGGAIHYVIDPVVATYAPYGMLLGSELGMIHYLVRELLDHHKHIMAGHKGDWRFDGWMDAAGPVGVHCSVWMLLLVGGWGFGAGLSVTIMGIAAIAHFRRPSKRGQTDA